MKYRYLLAAFLAFTLALVATPAPAQGPTPTDDEVNRIAKQLYCPVCESTPLSVETVPLPVFKSPCQIADPARFIQPPSVVVVHGVQ